MDADARESRLHYQPPTPPPTPDDPTRPAEPSPSPSPSPSPELPPELPPVEPHDPDLPDRPLRAVGVGANDEA